MENNNNEEIWGLEEEAEAVEAAVPDPAPPVVEDHAGDVDVGQARNLETVEGIPKPPKIPGKRSSVPNYTSDEVVVVVWAYIAMSEEEAIQAMPAQLRRIARNYPVKAKDLARQGRWNCPRTPEQSAEMRCSNPCALLARAKKAIEVIMNKITPVWHKLKAEFHNGWGLEDFLNETRLR